MHIWECKIGAFGGSLEMGSDSPMRKAVRKAYKELTGEEPNFVFSGWGAELTPEEQVVSGEFGNPSDSDKGSAK